jgi:hypothetical protein
VYKTYINFIVLHSVSIANLKHHVVEPVIFKMLNTCASLPGSMLSMLTLTFTLTSPFGLKVLRHQHPKSPTTICSVGAQRNSSMDVCHLDPLNARVVLELELEQVIETLNHVATHHKEQVEELHSLRDRLEAQLEVINVCIRDDEMKDEDDDTEDEYGENDDNSTPHTDSSSPVAFGALSDVEEDQEQRGDGSNDEKEMNSDVHKANIAVSESNDDSFVDAKELSDFSTTEFKMGDLSAKVRCRRCGREWESSDWTGTVCTKCFAGVEQIVGQIQRRAFCIVLQVTNAVCIGEPGRSR